MIKHSLNELSTRKTTKCSRLTIENSRQNKLKRQNIEINTKIVSK